MKENQISVVIKTRILELEDKLMDLIVISSNYDYVPVPIFEIEMNTIIKLNPNQLLNILINHTINVSYRDTLS